MPELPTGTVTFFFTDVEGSTRLWEERPEAMRRDMARHDAIAQRIVAACDGALVRSRGEGDSLFAVFARATNAIQAAVELQRALAAEEWGVETVSVRVAIHTGEADLRDGDYYGRDVNRCARLRAAAHGGQILVSQTVFDLVQESLPTGASLKELGMLQLQNLQRPERVYQVVHPELPGRFPPLRLLDVLPNNLPQQVTSFVGREREIADVKRLLETTRLLTVSGAGGTGKTRLILQVAAELLEGEGDGVWFVELAPLTDPVLVPRAVATVLGVREAPGRTLTEALVQHLSRRKMLILLDNCEHLLGACAELSDAILRACPDVRILASSREPLNITGEVILPLRTLSTPDVRRLPALGKLTQYDAVRLFVERASAAVPSFTVDNRSASAVAQIVHRLDGIPLALELAAARLRSLTVDELNNRLDQRFRILTGGSRTALPRQQTLRALIDWSYNLLNEEERTLLSRLAVFSGGWTLEAAERICAGEPVEEWEVLDLLTQLVEKSLIVSEEHEGESRGRLLETVRDYSRERLAETGEEGGIRQRHFEYFLHLAQRAEPELTGPDQAEWLRKLDRDSDNFRSALDWAEATGKWDELLQFCASFWRFWYVRDYLTEGRSRLSRVLAATVEGEKEKSREYRLQRARLVSAAGVLTSSQGDHPGARVLYAEALAVRRELGDRKGVALSLNNLALLATEYGDLEEGFAKHQDALDIYRELQDPRGIGYSLLGLGKVAYKRKDFVRSRELLGEARGLLIESGDPWGAAWATGAMEMTARESGDYDGARRLQVEALTRFRELGNRIGVAQALLGVAEIACWEGRWERLIRALSASHSLFDEMGTPIPAWERADYERLARVARESVDPEIFDGIWEEGRAMTFEEVVAYALDDPDAAPTG